MTFVIKYKLVVKVKYEIFAKKDKLIFELGLTAFENYFNLFRDSPSDRLGEIGRSTRIKTCLSTVFLYSPDGFPATTVQL